MLLPPAQVRLLAVETNIPCPRKIKVGLSFIPTYTLYTYTYMYLQPLFELNVLL